ncbi:hypothetical protein DM01DRAFT_1337856 [Hesseltinella vesiculosa]|uniref:Ig-like domain-containing protein n=1 Tax=Hesseltinella vesiculosa TaxID=101127 RepID=A0A1X2GBU5_9FUNG|nr:hypothetical protein DM01DRAFT_1337856 [Hesseltinella vesiculosa]
MLSCRRAAAAGLIRANGMVLSDRRSVVAWTGNGGMSFSGARKHHQAKSCPVPVYQSSSTSESAVLLIQAIFQCLMQVCKS